jgi:alkylhydroperoxidase family enzyme
MLRHPASASILDAADRAILALAYKIAAAPEPIIEADIEALRTAGLTEENVVDVIACAAYRVYANTLNFALGDVDRDPEGPEEILEAIRWIKEG